MTSHDDAGASRMEDLSISNFGSEGPIETPDDGSAARIVDASRDTLGGKGAGLLALARLGFKVPPGFTLSTAWCEGYREKGRTLLDSSRAAISRAITDLESATGKQLGNASGDLRVAVRSGAAESLPGMMDTVLDVDSLEDLFAAIERVWQSWTSPRAITYRRERGIISLRGTAVTVQAMCPAELAGVAFTVDPDTGAQVCVIEAVAGLGEALVSGDATPDRYRVERKTGRSHSLSSTGPSPLLDDDVLCALTRECLLVEAAFGYPVDIEWAIESDTIWLLQARAIRRSDTAARSRALRSAEFEKLRSDTRPARFVRYNLDETLAHPTPLSWSLHRRLFSGNGAFLALYEDLGFVPSERVREEGFLARIGGRIYAEIDRAAEIFYGSDVLQYDDQAVRARPERLQEPPDAWNRRGATLAKALRLARTALRSGRRLQSLRRTFPSRFRESILPQFLEWCGEAREVDLEKLDAPSALEELDRRIARVFDEFPRRALLLSLLAGAAWEELCDLLERRLGSCGAQSTQLLTGGLEEEPETDLAAALAELSEGRLDREQFDARFGHRATREMEIAEPRWHEDPASALRAAESLRGDRRQALEERRDERRREQATEHDRIVQQLRQLGPEAIAEYERALESARELLPWRDRWKHWWLLGLDVVRRSLLDLDRRLGLEGQIFWLELEEIREAVSAAASKNTRAIEGRISVGADIVARVRERREVDRVSRSIDLPEFLTEDDVLRLAASSPSQELDRPGPPDDDRTMQATPIAAGTAVGSVWICDGPDATPPEGAWVLVCSSTDPGWTPLLARARALVVERGGALSHGAIVCRDFGVPAVVVSDATKRLSPGETVRVDGSSGKIERSGAVADGSPTTVGAREAPPGESEHQVGPEPWVPRSSPRLAAFAIGAVLLAVVASLLIVGIPTLRALTLRVVAPLFDWLLDRDLSTGALVAIPAAVAALSSTLLGLAASSRSRLRSIRERLRWYRGQARRLRRASKGVPRESAAAAGLERSRASIERRRRQASTERVLELLRPVGLSFLPFCLVFVWVQARLTSEPIRKGEAFTIEARLDPRDTSLRRVRLDVDREGKLQMLDPAWTTPEPSADAGRGPYRASWSVVAHETGRFEVGASARDERIERDVLVTSARRLSPDDQHVERSVSAASPELLSLDVVRPATLVHPPEPIYRGVDFLAKKITGGRGVTRDQAAFSSTTAFLILAILLTLLLQRLFGLR